MSFLTALKNLTDSRRLQARKFELHNVVLCCVLALLADANSYRDISLFIKVNFKILKRWLDLTWKDPPVYTTIRNILLSLDLNEIQNIMQNEAFKYLSEKEISEIQIAIDGKSNRGSFDRARNKDCAHLLIAFVTEHNLILSHNNVRETKTNEIPVAQKTIKKLKRSNILFSMDALHCQAGTLREVKQTSNDLLVQVKENQAKLLAICHDRYAIKSRQETLTTRGKEHGRLEKRVYTVCDRLPGYYEGKFADFNSVIRVYRERELLTHQLANTTRHRRKVITCVLKECLQLMLQRQYVIIGILRIVVIMF